MHYHVYEKNKKRKKNERREKHILQLGFFSYLLFLSSHIFSSACFSFSFLFSHFIYPFHGSYFVFLSLVDAFHSFHAIPIALVLWLLVFCPLSYSLSRSLFFLPFLWVSYDAPYQRLEAQKHLVIKLARDLKTGHKQLPSDTSTSLPRIT